MRHYTTIFFGTQEFAAIILQGLIDSPLFTIALVVTQPDKPMGRKKIITPPITKVLAEKHSIPVAQPLSLKGFDLSPYPADIAIVAQYGKIIPEELLSIPTYQTLNVHTSLLPKYRGASPIQSAIMNGDTTTGVTIMQMNAGLDTGPIISQRPISIGTNETYPELERRLARLSTELLLETVPDYINGTLLPKKQDEKLATHCSQLTREDGQIDWRNTATKVYNQYRGMTPWPGIWPLWGEKRLKLLDIAVSEKHVPPGTVLAEDGTLYIGCSTGAVQIHLVQLEGKPRMDVRAFLMGNANINGAILLSPPPLT